MASLYRIYEIMENLATSKEEESKYPKVNFNLLIDFASKGDWTYLARIFSIITSSLNPNGKLIL